MSLYNMLFGMNVSLTVMLSPFLPRKPQDFPRFRNVFTGDEEDPTGVDADIFVYTRMGGGNRECTQYALGGDSELDDADGNCICGACDAEKLEEHENCIKRYDDSFDFTYSTFCFIVPEKWKTDHQALTEGNFRNLSDKYWDTLFILYSDDKKIVKQLKELREEVNKPKVKETDEEV